MNNYVLDQCIKDGYVFQQLRPKGRKKEGHNVSHLQWWLGMVSSALQVASFAGS